MRTKIKITIALLLLISTLPLEAQKKEKNVATVKFETSIECDGCVNTIMNNIPFEKGVRDVKCDLGTKEVTIDYQANKTKPESLKRALEKLGITAKEVKPKS